jgi:AcrR family transcriptional regulator
LHVVPARTRPPTDDQPRDAILDAARDLLAHDGPDSLTVRRIADRAGCSTMGLYTHFGGKDGVVDALFVEGFRRLAETMSATPITDDPVADLRASCGAYRRFALENPTHYLVMFERHVPGFDARPESKIEAFATLGLLQDRVQRCLDAGVIDARHGDAEEIAYSIWAVGHGLMSLELHGIGPRDDFEARYHAATATLYAGLTHPPAPEIVRP